MSSMPKTHTGKPAAIFYEAAKSPSTPARERPTRRCFAPMASSFARAKMASTPFTPSSRGGVANRLRCFVLDAKAGLPQASLDRMPDPARRRESQRCRRPARWRPGRHQIPRPGRSQRQRRDASGIDHRRGGCLASGHWLPGVPRAGAWLPGNGILVSRDGKWVFISDYGQLVFRVALDGSGRS